jgi:hypothetical protein
MLFCFLLMVRNLKYHLPIPAFNAYISFHLFWLNIKEDTKNYEKPKKTTNKKNLCRRPFMKTRFRFSICNFTCSDWPLGIKCNIKMVDFKSFTSNGWICFQQGMLDVFMWGSYAPWNINGNFSVLLVQEDVMSPSVHYFANYFRH